MGGYLLAYVNPFFLILILVVKIIQILRMGKL